MGYMARQVENEGANAMLVLHSPGCKVSMRLIGSSWNSPTGPIYIHSAHLPDSFQERFPSSEGDLYLEDGDAWVKWCCGGEGLGQTKRTECPSWMDGQAT
jgi:hypothetical protein